MKTLYTIEDRVKIILTKDKKSRDDDMLLYLKVCNDYLKDAGTMTFAEVMTQYKHLGLADGGNGANGGRGQAVFGTRLSDEHKSRWERYNVLGEIKPECMPSWAKEALAKMDKPKEQAKKPHSREER